MGTTFKRQQEVREILNKEFLTHWLIEKKVRYKDVAVIVGCQPAIVSLQAKCHGIKRKRRNLRMGKKKEIENKGFVFIDEYEGSHVLTRFFCHCGKEFYTYPTSILVGNTTSCGCLRRKHYNGINKGYLRSLRDGAVQRNLEFDITIEDIWDQYIKQDRKCAITNLYVYWEYPKGTGVTNFTASVDRIDNNKGYTKDNIQIVHKRINVVKMQHGMDFFVFLAKLTAINLTFDSNKFSDWEKSLIHETDYHLFNEKSII